MKQIAKCMATLGPIGYLPAPGTMGTLVTLPCAYYLSQLSLWYQFNIVIALTIFSFMIIHVSLNLFTVKDPSQIIIDEVIGCLITFIGIKTNPASLLAGFVFFRFFDIAKPCGIKRIEHLPGAYGVLLDDCFAGLFANVVIRILFFLYCI